MGLVFSSVYEPSSSPQLHGQCQGRSQFIHAEQLPNVSGSLVLGAYSGGAEGYVEFRSIEGGSVHSHDVALPAGGAVFIRSDGWTGDIVEFEVTCSVDATWAAWTTDI